MRTQAALAALVGTLLLVGCEDTDTTGVLAPTYRTRDDPREPGRVRLRSVYVAELPDGRERSLRNVSYLDSF